VTFGKVMGGTVTGGSVIAGTVTRGEGGQTNARGRHGMAAPRPQLLLCGRDT
jgi:hypothetical protein